MVLLGIAGAFWGWQRSRAGRLIPLELAGGIPPECQQVVLVLPDGIHAVPAQVWLLERAGAGSFWQVAAGPWPASVGENGAGWGRGEPVLANPGNYPDKREGDGRSPAGIFRLPFAFGSSPAASPGVKLPWQECTSTLRGVDDVKSKYYNQIVDEATVPDKDCDSAEIMRREDGLYEMGVMIGHNPDRVAGGGSCIFLHLWKGPGQGTSGCTALAAENVREIITWLDPGKEPRLVLGVPGQ